MTGYKNKSEIELAWAEGVLEVRHRAKLALNRVLNHALTELDRQFQYALARGELLSLVPDDDALRELLVDAAQKQLLPGGQDAKSE